MRIIVTDDPASLSVRYCTDDTNGHVMYLAVDSRDTRKITLSCLHGMSDFAGCMALMRTMLYEYRLILEPDRASSAEALAAAGIRTAVPDDWERPENLDAYNVCGIQPDSSGGGSAPEMPFVVQGLPLYKPESGANHIWHVTTDSQAFLAKCRSIGTTFAPLIIDTLISTVSDCFDPGEETVTAGLPVDMRPIFGVAPVTNFSDSVMLPMSQKERKLEIEERCGLLKQRLTSQRTAEHMGPALYGKAQSTKAMMDDPAGFVQVADRMLAPILAGVPSRAPLTFMVTYPGKTDLPAPLAGLVDNVMPVSIMGKVKFYFLISTCGSVMTFQVCQRFDGDTLPRILAEKLRQLGLTAKVSDRGIRRQGGSLLPDKLTCVD